MTKLLEQQFLTLSLRSEKYAIPAAIIVVEMVGDEGSMVVGLIADAVHEVIEITSDLIENAPKFGAGTAEYFLCGVGRKDEEFILILDMDRLFAAEEIRFPAETEVVEA
jgi:purine-binding chemotaxis protein CheW